MKTQIILPTAGLGVRLNADTPKPFIDLKGKPLFVYCLETFMQCDLVDSIILVGHSDYLDQLQVIVDEYKVTKVVKIVAGGATRSESVKCGVDALDNDTDIVAVHDAARPLLDQDTLVKSIQAMEVHQAAIVAVKAKSTIKQANDQGEVIATPDRSSLWEVQTPQVFKKDVLVNAHNQTDTAQATDDAMLVESLGITVQIVEGTYSNIKVTTQEDIKIAEALL